MNGTVNQVQSRHLSTMEVPMEDEKAKGLTRYMLAGKVAETCDVSRTTVYDWVAAGRLSPAAVLEIGKAEWQLFLVTDVEELRRSR